MGEPYTALVVASRDCHDPLPLISQLCYDLLDAYDGKPVIVAGPYAAATPTGLTHISVLVQSKPGKACNAVRWAGWFKYYKVVPPDSVTKWMVENIHPKGGGIEGHWSSTAEGYTHVTKRM